MVKVGGRLQQQVACIVVIKFHQIYYSLTVAMAS
jgi:hypothetical protein